MTPEDTVKIGIAAVSGGGFTVILIRALISSWLSQRREFEERMEQEILRTRERLHKLANEVNEAVLMARLHQKWIDKRDKSDD